MQCFWVKKLFDGNHCHWKIIPLFLINNYPGKNFDFRLNLSFNLSLVDGFSELYKQMLINWSTYFVSFSEVLFCIQSNFFWYIKHLLIDITPVYLQLFANKKVNFLDILLAVSGNFKSWNELKAEFNLADNLYFAWMQLISSIPLNWRNIIKNNCFSTNLLLRNHHLAKKNNSISLDKLHCQELYNMLVYISRHKPTSQLCFEIKI